MRGVFALSLTERKRKKIHPVAMPGRRKKAVIVNERKKRSQSRSIATKEGSLSKRRRGSDSRVVFVTGKGGGTRADPNVYSGGGEGKRRALLWFWTKVTACGPMPPREKRKEGADGREGNRERAGALFFHFSRREGRLFFSRRRSHCLLSLKLFPQERKGKRGKVRRSTYRKKKSGSLLFLTADEGKDEEESSARQGEGKSSSADKEKEEGKRF